MERYDGDSEDGERRFLVVVAFLDLPGGKYRQGDVLTERMLGGGIEEMERLDMVVEGDYELEDLFYDVEEAPAGTEEARSVPRDSGLPPMLRPERERVRQAAREARARARATREAIRVSRAKRQSLR